MFKAVRKLGGRIKRIVFGEAIAGEGVAGAGAAEAIVAGWGLERLWDKFTEWHRENPLQAESFSHAVTYLRQWATKTPAPQTMDIYLDAWTKLEEDDAELLAQLTHKLTRIGGHQQLLDRDKLNMAQNLFAIMAVQFPEQPGSLKVDSPNREELVDLTFRRLRMFARMPDDVWNETCDVLNLTAPEREKAVMAFLEKLDAEAGKAIKNVDSAIGKAISAIDTGIVDPVHGWIDDLSGFADRLNFRW